MTKAQQRARQAATVTRSWEVISRQLQVDAAARRRLERQQLAAARAVLHSGGTPDAVAAALQAGPP